MRAVGVIGQADEGQRNRVQHVTSLSRNMRLCSYVLISLFQLESDDIGSIPQPPAWFPMFPILDRAIV
jgi:hypothetical protein